MCLLGSYSFFHRLRSCGCAPSSRRNPSSKTQHESLPGCFLPVTEPAVMENLKLFAASAVLAVFLSSCDICYLDRPELAVKNHVAILYSVGYNDLSGSLKSDIEDLGEGFLPGRCDDKALLVVAHHSVTSGDFTTPVDPCIIRMYKEGGVTVRDTVLTMDASTDTLTTVEGMRKALTYIKDKYPSLSYGLIFSSHGTGWMPAGAYDKYNDEGGGLLFAAGADRPAAAVFTPGYAYLDELVTDPDFKSFGASIYRRPSGLLSRELEVSELAAACPMHFDYMIFDACLAGGIESAYQLRHVCDLYCASQTEILSDGFDYKNMGERLLSGEVPDPVQVCRDFYNYYNEQTGTRQSATVSAVDCRMLQPLAAYTKLLLARYVASVDALNPSDVQGYYRGGHHWFYDFEDILQKAGISETEKSELAGCLEKCIRYKAATPHFFASFDIVHHSGFSMYLPNNGNEALNDYYRTLEWNEATGLVK